MVFGCSRTVIAEKLSVLLNYPFPGPFAGKSGLLLGLLVSALLGVSGVLDSSPARIWESKGKPRELTAVLFFGS